METKRQRRLSIVIWIRNQQMSGVWKNAAEEASHEITIDGETTFRCRKAVWSTIFSNLQLNMLYDACRILIASNQPLDAEELPSLQNVWPWEKLEEISRLILTENHIGKWYINGADLKGRYAKCFPTSSGKTDGSCYIYTIPILRLEESTGMHTPLPVVVQKLNEKQSRQ